MCEIVPNSPASIIRFAVTAQNEYRVINGTDTQAPLAAARPARSATVSGSVPQGFSITNGTPASTRKRKISGMSQCRPSATTNSGRVSSIIRR